jgi:uncharacterized protein (DUF697 family)
MGYAETLRRVMEGDFGTAGDEEKRKAVKELIEVCSIAAGAVTIQPIPFVDTALIAPIQIAMVQAIGRVHGHKLDRKSVVEILSTLGASIVAQNVIMAAAKLIPFFGWVVTISMAYALTWAIGEVSDLYFKTGRGVSTDVLKEKFQAIYKEKKAEKESANKSNQTLKEKLEQLKEAYAGGLLTEEEFSKKKEELLKSF